LNLDDARAFLEAAVEAELKARRVPKFLRKQAEFYRGVRWGAFQMLVKLGYEDVAEETIRALYEDKGMDYERLVSGVGRKRPMTIRRIAGRYRG
jgi:hypothetical protein